ncbi:hypothetical protein WOLCODRAFT_105454 [Wolfiporia cocos MD-104 SS10]|uniref:CXC domain-containing protein n=1 Tax=Wolfiporia cocos (strain MD-104) TaxID=742152 RepID=A0A2H3K6G0_WOLCO|nr:hypothetical protein WOLCODRAFT_105454 [Wolfiporia cocos MD-104 SS10]
MSSDEGEDLLPTQQLHAKRPQDELDDEDSHHERHLLRQLEEIRDDRQKVTTAYRTAWTNFYAWEAEACNSTLASLAAPLEHSRSGRSLAELFDADDSDEDQIVDDSTLAATFTTVDFDTDGTITSSCERIIIPEVTPHPKYESCTPATKVVRVSKSESCPFVPYAGEPGFSAQDYIQTFSSTDWQHRWHDPDIIYIALEAVKLLGEMPIKSIDSWGILPTLLDNNRQIGIARKLKRHYGELWRTAALKDIDYDNLVNRLNNTEECFNLLKENEKFTLFCPRLSCIEGSCLTHLGLPIIKCKERKPHKQTGDLEQKDTCGPQCFSAILDGPNKHDMLNPVDAQLVHDLWSLFPDESPCDIAIMARLPCYQVQYQRTLKFSDHDISPKPNHNFKLPSGFKFVDDSPEVYLSAAPLSPCSHFGSCESRGCECFRNHVHCQRNCQCDLQCPLRHQGCRCPKGCKKSCKCRMASRECDPEICKSRC